MKVLSWGWAVPGVALMLSSCHSAEEGTSEGEAESEKPAYVLAREGHRHPDGAVLTETHSVRMAEASMTLVEGGARRVGTMTMTTERQLRTERLSESSRRLEVLKDDRTLTRTVDGAPETSPAWTNPVLGQPLRFQEVGGGWEGDLESGVAGEDQQREIASLAADLGNREDLEMFGTEPRRVGDEWEVDPRTAAVLGEGGEIRGHFRLRFDRVEEFGGDRCAVLTGTINVRSQPGAEGGGSGIEIVAEATIVRSLDHLVTRRLEIVGTALMQERSGPADSLVARGPLIVVREAEISLP